MNNRIIYLDEKLQDLRNRYRSASPVMRKFLEAGAKAIKAEKESIEKRELKNSVAQEHLL